MLEMLNCICLSYLDARRNFSSGLFVLEFHTDSISRSTWYWKAFSVVCTPFCGGKNKTSADREASSVSSSN